MEGEHEAQVSLKYQNREENGPSEAPVRVGRKMEEEKGYLVGFNSRAAIPSALSASQCSHLTQSPPESGDDVPATWTTRFSSHLSPHPDHSSLHFQELRTGLFPQGTASVPAILPPLVCAGTHMGPRLKSFRDREDIIKLCRQGSGWDLDHFPQTERNTSPFFFFPFLQETKFSEFLSH